MKDRLSPLYLRVFEITNVGSMVKTRGLQKSTLTIMVIISFFLLSAIASSNFFNLFVSADSKQYGSLPDNFAQLPAANGSPPTEIGTPNVLIGTTNTPFAVKVTNPVTNVYAIKSLTVKIGRA